MADDLTGACDAAVPFLAVGHGVRVWLGAAADHDSTESVQSFNTGSRAFAPRDAAAITAAAFSGSRSAETLHFKKVDSAARGPFSQELLAAHHALGTRAILFAPAFPAAGRTVQGGVLSIRDAAGAARLVPLAPLFDDAVHTALVADPSEMEDAIEDGATVLLCDALTQADLDRLAASALPNMLYAGSAGLAQSLASLHSGAVSVVARQHPRANRCLTICGTTHPVTGLQMHRLAQSHPTSSALLIEATPADASTILLQFEREHPDALLLTGGDTALLVLRTLGAQSILLRGELEPGIPWGVVQGGLADGRIVITKSGGFGSPDSLSAIHRELAQ